MTRFTDLTDAAIAVVAEQGMRGLTHRAVDARAGLPLGTTSAYFRTRKALIEGLVGRLAELDNADVATQTLDPPPTDPTAFADAVAGVLDTWLTAGRERTLARYACLLEATHHPELRTILAYGRASRDQARALMTAAGVANPGQAGDHFVACVDGLLFDRLAGAGALTAPAPGTPENRADLATAVGKLLAAFTAS
ncbi:TetR family transcriptional regulator [Asanoa sp. WMMD1127]|uniref:TetR/AcrR family transcriptional regulator n=1 Tax=Asanoa sp. WMMD1127 TaxID=3016107 RepID=UPI002417F67E|nr:TetR/AcrR family transcriptional regulator [Asanoa sp. WMMD1127]MDG4824032.1 TetR family transcriptional regulator [Asanoa sp. WMMD1127]